jgi:hypothetical protein
LTLKKELKEKDFYFASSHDNESILKSFEKICICVNNVIFIKDNVIKKLETILNFDEAVTKLQPIYNDLKLKENLQ